MTNRRLINQVITGILHCMYSHGDTLYRTSLDTSDRNNSRSKNNARGERREGMERQGDGTEEATPVAMTGPFASPRHMQTQYRQIYPQSWTMRSSRGPGVLLKRLLCLFLRISIISIAERSLDVSVRCNTMHSTRGWSPFSRLLEIVHGRGTRGISLKMLRKV